MSHVDIETSQNVTIEYEYASLLMRIGGWCFDAIIIIFYIFAVLWIQTTLSSSDMAYGLGVIFYTPIFFYDLIFEYFFAGQSPGKMLLKMRVVRVDGSPPSFVSYFIRWIARVIDIAISMGSLAILSYFVTGKGQRLGDLAAGTVVINSGKSKIIKQLILPNFPPNYKVTYPEAKLLSDADVNLITEVLRRVKESGISDTNNQLISKTASLLNERLGLSMRYSTEELQRLVDDYQFLILNQE